MMKNNFEFGLFMVAPFVGVRIEISGTEVTEMSCSVAPFMGAWIEIWVSQAEFARSGIVFDFGDSSAQAEAAKKWKNMYRITVSKEYPKQPIYWRPDIYRTLHQFQKNQPVTAVSICRRKVKNFWV